MRSLNQLNQSVHITPKIKSKQKTTEAKAEFDKSIVSSMKATAAKPQPPEFSKQILFKG